MVVLTHADWTAIGARARQSDRSPCGAHHRLPSCSSNTKHPTPRIVRSRSRPKPGSPEHPLLLLHSLPLSSPRRPSSRVQSNPPLNSRDGPSHSMARAPSRPTVLNSRLPHAEKRPSLPPSPLCVYTKLLNRPASSTRRQSSFALTESSQAVTLLQPRATVVAPTIRESSP